jgi:hypothetical protein
MDNRFTNVTALRVIKPQYNHVSTLNRAVRLHRRRDYIEAFCVSGLVVSAALSLEPIARRTRRIGSVVMATRPLRPSTVTKHLGQLARILMPAVTASRLKGKSSRDADRKGNVCLTPTKSGRELSNP